jgi:hypothetical protein
VISEKKGKVNKKRNNKKTLTGQLQSPSYKEPKRRKVKGK